ncbi:hypothetical protein [Leptospira weilii]|uniref:hypothetical protein n=1 Tax=Leptospira weilii TaxID=28184 RepID=UPI0002BE9BDB|nr:hypothetical protein [Leptospira weilii]EMN42569.1 hypothetical protein LEP1GSC086_1427 [Leptospira weilii str. LNT 1234]
MKYHLLGYYLIQFKKLNFGSLIDREVYTCSTCLNTSLMCNFARSWTCSKEDMISACQSFTINSQTIKEIQNWTDLKDIEGQTQYIEAFSSTETAREYKNIFFAHLNKIHLLGVYLPESESKKLIEDFNSDNPQCGEIGIRKIIKREETESELGKIVGFDLIGVERSGNFHSFQCHDLEAEFKKKFKVEFNDFGLIKNEEHWEKLVEYANDEKNGCEPVPWYFAKLKKFEL